MEASAAAADHRLVRLLVETGVIGEDEIVDGDLVLRDLSRRNLNILIERSPHPCLFVKAAGGQQDRGALEREAGRYRWLATAGVASLAPRLVAHDPARGMLVLEGIPQAPDLRAVHLGGTRATAGIGALLGDALGSLHDAASGSTADGPSEGFPWIFTIHRPTVDALRRLNPSSVDLVKVIQGEPAIGRELDGLCATWEPTAMVHYDLKWDNVLVDGGQARPALWIVDWEHAGAGDPLWDVGSAIAGYLSFWLYSIDVRAGVPPSVLAERARFPLEHLTPAVRALWSAYRRRRGADDASGEMALRAARMAGARLLLAAHEATESGASVNAHLVLHVQVAANLLSRPGDALERLGLAGGGPGEP